ncbi:hypothetical protein SeLEV6574_g03966 [Synchytrium endobioticum]|uniref:Uncharacterized protein n=1 Tax=Synchytrium endobioticum TaxID=286115 RepID=A0A507D1C9_9FUNG|nr:hypothetical protein SeLEV6574_g03966 [Synchytrium endobioticum]
MIDSVEKYAKKISKLENAIGVLKDVNQIKSRKEVDQVKVDNTSLLMDKLMKMNADVKDLKTLKSRAFTSAC